MLTWIFVTNLIPELIIERHLSVKAKPSGAE